MECCDICSYKIIGKIHTHDLEDHEEPLVLCKLCLDRHMAQVNGKNSTG